MSVNHNIGGTMWGWRILFYAGLYFLLVCLIVMAKNDIPIWIPWIAGAIIVLGATLGW